MEELLHRSTYQNISSHALCKLTVAQLLLVVTCGKHHTIIPSTW
jgi:hypothetical protein